MPRSSHPPPPAADQIDDGEDSDGTRNSARSAAVAAAAASAAAVQTPPNSFVDPSAFKAAFEKHYQEMQKKFPTAAASADHAAGAAEGRPLQEALRTMRASNPGRQQQPTSKPASAATSTAEMTEAEFEKLFNEMRLGPPPIGDALGDESLLPMMETMMQSLLSKDLLYPAIRDLADRFPDWLAEKRGELSAEQFGKFNRQYELTKQASIMSMYGDEAGKESSDRVPDCFFLMLKIRYATPMRGRGRTRPRKQRGTNSRR